MRVAINGFGRIGRSFFRLALQDPKIEIRAINDLAGIDNLLYLLKYDTVYGRYDGEVKIQSREKIAINGKEILFFQEKDPINLPWKELKIDVVVEATGVFDDYLKAKAHIEAGAKKVIITAPANGEEEKEGRTVLLGINDEELAKFEVISNGSCTTNAVSPVIQVLEEKIGIEKAVLNTVHAYTSSQRLVDSVSSDDWRRGRAAQNIIPSTTGAAKCVAKVIKSLKDKFDGIALRVPVVCGSIADITFVAKRPTSREEINGILEQASKEKRWEGIIEVSNQLLVSSDIIGTLAPAIVDLNFTKVIDNDLVKILVWYDNEWAYSSTLLQQVKKL
ncbi:MAG: type I glyceraldehyde-3-phosphate dehydrogenase [Candidatus Pacebacteria bacterium]|nr:type I glyceraldehyde-3-phosphate dehydrogenase [Candidatus Paceibacterota bacterium]